MHDNPRADLNKAEAWRARFNDVEFAPEGEVRREDLACRAASPRKCLEIRLGHDSRQLRFGGKKSMINMMLFNPENPVILSIYRQGVLGAIGIGIGIE